MIHVSEGDMMVGIPREAGVAQLWLSCFGDLHQGIISSFWKGTSLLKMVFLKCFHFESYWEFAGRGYCHSMWVFPAWVTTRTGSADSNCMKSRRIIASIFPKPVLESCLLSRGVKWLLIQDLSVFRHRSYRCIHILEGSSGCSFIFIYIFNSSWGDWIIGEAHDFL